MRAIFLSATFVAASAAVAQAPSEGPATQKTGVVNDPNEIVCINEPVIGSRLARRRVCRTRAEWAESRTEVKQEVERAQQQMQTQY